MWRWQRRWKICIVLLLVPVILLYLELPTEDPRPQKLAPGRHKWLDLGGMKTRFALNKEKADKIPTVGPPCPSAVISSIFNSLVIHCTPQGKPSGPLRVLYDHVIAEVPQDGVTLCSHATIDMLHHVATLAHNWDGPLSVTVFVPGSDYAAAISIISWLRTCGEEAITQKVTFHLLFTLRHPPLLPVTLHRYAGAVNCSSPNFPTQIFSTSTYRSLHNLTYPINAARNIARAAAKTHFVMVCDIELVPSPQLVGEFLTMLRHAPPPRRQVYAVPAFEVENGHSIPKSKDQLLQMIGAGHANVFHAWVCSHCQSFPGVKRWLKEPAPAKVKPFAVVRREFSYHRWEPIYISTNHEPLYDERLTWEGRQDKMTQMHEMCLLHYRFVILDGAFLVHVPGVRRWNNSITPNPDRVAENVRTYNLIISEMSARYGLHIRCRAH